MANKLKEALARLDVDNDAHWTKGGLPSIEHLEKELDAKVARREVEAAQPGFTRENPVVEPDGVDEEDFLSDENEDGAQAMSAEASPAPEQEDPTTDTLKLQAAASLEAAVAEVEGKAEEADFLADEDPGDGSGVDTLRRAVAKAASRVDAVKTWLEEGRKALEAAQADYSKACEELDRACPPMTNAQNIRHWLDSQNELRRQRAGLAPTAGVQRSALDQSMAPKRGRARPNFHPKA